MFARSHFSSFRVETPTRQPRRPLCDAERGKHAEQVVKLKLSLSLAAGNIHHGPVSLVLSCVIGTLFKLAGSSAIMPLGRATAEITYSG